MSDHYSINLTNHLITPLLNIFTGKIALAQRIDPNGKKMNNAGFDGSLPAAFFCNHVENPDKIYIAEGFATACSVYEAVINEPNSLVLSSMGTGRIATVLNAVTELAARLNKDDANKVQFLIHALSHSKVVLSRSGYMLPRLCSSNN